MPHCVVCGFSSGVPVEGSVEFADYHAGWRDPVNAQGQMVIGWSNELGVTAPAGVGLFCRRHLRQARRLRRLSAREAVARMEAGGRFGALRVALRRRSRRNL